MTNPNDSAPVLGFAAHDHTACRDGSMARAEAVCDRDKLRLTPLRRRTLEILLESHSAMGAYEVLARLDAEGLASKPPMAYRALGFLVDHGLAHRIERDNAYVACAHPDAAHSPVFLICSDCGAVAESAATLTLDRGQGMLARAARDTGFAIDRAVVEAVGLCPACQSKDAA